MYVINNREGMRSGKVYSEVRREHGGHLTHDGSSRLIRAIEILECEVSVEYMVKGSVRTDDSAVGEVAYMRRDLIWRA